VIANVPAFDAARDARRARGLARALSEPVVRFGIAVIALVALLGIAAPWLGTMDPGDINPNARNRPSGFVETSTRADGSTVSRRHWMGTDTLGRDVYSRVLYGARASLVVGASVAALAVTLGLAIGLAAGCVRWVDAIVMRAMDGLMAIPAILLAILVMSISSAGMLAVVVAIAVPEVPRVARLVRSVVLSAREEPFVDAAVALGTPPLAIVVRHVMPSTYAPLIVQATYVAASAILIEAILSFLGVGIPPETPTWGNIMAQGRALFRLFPHNVLYPGLFLAVTILAVNLLGDGLRDALDPRRSRRET